jgi:hypothetical protein
MKPDLILEELERLRKRWHAMVRWYFSFAPYLDPEDQERVARRLLNLKERIERIHEEYVVARR